MLRRIIRYFLSLILGILLYLCAVITLAPGLLFVTQAQAGSLTNALLGQRLNIDQLSRKLLVSLLLLPQERERQDLPDRVVIRNELHRAVSLQSALRLA